MFPALVSLFSLHTVLRYRADEPDGVERHGGIGWNILARFLEICVRLFAVGSSFGSIVGGMGIVVDAHEVLLLVNKWKWVSAFSLCHMCL